MRRFTIIFMLGMLAALLAACGGESTAGDGLMVNDVTANLTLPTDTGAVYMRITNGGDSDDALIDAALDGCGTIELHEIIMDDDVMQMRQIEGNRIPIPAGETVMFERGGLHVMCIDKTGEFTVGQAVPVTLTFENAGEMEVTADVIDPADTGMEMEGGMEEGDMDSDETP